MVTATGKVLQFPHFGICVGDIAVSSRFYVEALGFELTGMGGRARGLGDLLQLPGAESETCFIKHPHGFTIELYTVVTHGTIGSSEAMPSNHRGLSHLCLVVDNIDAVAAKIAIFGGTVLDATRTELGHSTLIFCADPDGVRIELVQVSDTGWLGYQK